MVNCALNAIFYLQSRFLISDNKLYTYIHITLFRNSQNTKIRFGIAQNASMAGNAVKKSVRIATSSVAVAMKKRVCIFVLILFFAPCWFGK